jgi:hypothetical protein
MLHLEVLLFGYTGKYQGAGLYTDLVLAPLAVSLADTHKNTKSYVVQLHEHNPEALRKAGVLLWQVAPWWNARVSAIVAERQDHITCGSRLP